MQAYFENKAEGQGIGRFITLLVLAFAIIGFLVAEQIITGWLPLGARANISRRDINPYEIIVIIFSILYGIACLRTAWGLFIREKASHRWAQWMLFITMFIGIVIILSVLIPTGLKFVLLLGQNIDLRSLLEEQAGIGALALVAGEVIFILSLLALSLLALFSLLAFLIPPMEVLRKTPVVSLIFAPPTRIIQILFAIFGLGILFLLVAGAFAVPQFPGVTKIREVEFSRLIYGGIAAIFGFIGYLQVRQVEEVSDELRRAVALTPGKYIRAELAKSPSAGAIIGFVAIFFGFTMATDLFLEQSSIASFLTNVSTKGIIAIGVTYLMISGEFDLSVGSILGVASLSFMLFMTEGAPLVGVLDPFSAALASLFVAFILGAINGIILITTRIPSFIVTLGTLLAYRAITLVAIAGGRILRYRDYYGDFPIIEIPAIVFVICAVIGLAVIAFTAYRVLPGLFSRARHAWEIRHDNGDFGTTGAIIRSLYFVVILLILLAFIAWLLFVATFHLGNMGGEVIQVGFFDLANGRVGSLGGEVTRGLVNLEIDNSSNIRLSILWWLIFVIVFHIILTSTSFGNSIFATGGNPGAARAQGINVDRVKVQNFVLVALLTGIAAIYEVARNPGVDPLKGQGWELEVIAMTVIGGALLTGGYGSVLGSLLGALIFGMLQTGLVLVGIESRLFSGTVGVIIIVAVVLNTVVRGARRN